MTERPAPRIKRIETKEIAAIKIAQPCIQPDENIVDVDYLIIVQDKQSGKVREINELHRMRYLFMPEIRSMLRIAGFAPNTSLQWRSFSKKLSFESWYGVIIAEAK